MFLKALSGLANSVAGKEYMAWPRLCVLGSACGPSIEDFLYRLERAASPAARSVALATPITPVFFLIIPGFMGLPTGGGARSLCRL